MKPEDSSAKPDSTDEQKKEAENQEEPKVPQKPQRPSVLRLRDSETTAQHKARRDDGVW
jgi:hypothetical protein